MEMIDRFLYYIPWIIYFIIASQYFKQKIPKYLKLSDEKLSAIAKKIISLGLQQFIIVGFYLSIIRILNIESIGVWVFYYLIFLPSSILLLWLSGKFIDFLILKKLN
jgi:hypothetical protein